MYGVALFVAFSSIISGSSGAVSPNNALEYYMMTFMLVVGSAVWAYVISTGCAVIATMDPNGMHYRRMMDELNHFAKDKHLPANMTVKLYAHARHASNLRLSAAPCSDMRA